MTPSLSVSRDGKKYMWDGLVYETSEEASRAEEKYRNDNFDVQLAEEGGKFLVYTRRVVKEIAATVQ